MFEEQIEKLKGLGVNAVVLGERLIIKTRMGTLAHKIGDTFTITCSEAHVRNTVSVRSVYLNQMRICRCPMNDYDRIFAALEDILIPEAVPVKTLPDDCLDWIPLSDLPFVVSEHIEGKVSEIIKQEMFQFYQLDVKVGTPYNELPQLYRHESVSSFMCRNRVYTNECEFGIKLRCAYNDTLGVYDLHYVDLVKYN